jgi:PKD repeat protein
MKLNINRFKSFKGVLFALLPAIAFYSCEVQDTDYEFVDTGLPVSLYASQSIGLEVSFSNESSHSTTYIWDFGDGNTSDLDAPVHLFTAKGEYTVTLTASDNNNATNTYSSVLEVGFPMAGFTYVGNQGTVVFTNSSNNATSYLWDFGDGATSTEENPTHIFASGGNYKVTLTAIDGIDENILESDVFVNSKVLPTILSPGFEDSAPWKINWNASDAIGGTGGGYEGRGAKFKDGAGEISQTLNVSPDDGYTISAYTWTKGGSAGIDVTILAEDGVTILGQQKWLPSSEKDWVQKSISFATETSSSITLLIKNTPGTPGEVRLDSVTID